MQTLYDIVISVALGGLLLSMLVMFNGNLVEGGTAQSLKIMTQTNFTEVTKDLEFSLRKMGYRVPAANDSAIVIADSNKIKFKGDFDNNGTVDTLTYYLNPAASGNQNTNTHVLNMTLNAGAVQKINIGITKFRLTYYDAAETPYTTYPVSTPSKISSIKVSMNLESKVPYKLKSESYVKLNPGVYWERTFKPKNLK
ncbi:MAG TPA: hypothetical protein VI215_04865 [Bacteroidota bacterium]|jgi:hypothetical protein